MNISHQDIARGAYEGESYELLRYFPLSLRLIIYLVLRERCRNLEGPTTQYLNLRFFSSSIKTSGNESDRKMPEKPTKWKWDMLIHLSLSLSLSLSQDNHLGDNINTLQLIN